MPAQCSSAVCTHRGHRRINRVQPGQRHSLHVHLDPRRHVLDSVHEARVVAGDVLGLGQLREHSRIAGVDTLEDVALGRLDALDIGELVGIQRLPAQNFNRLGHHVVAEVDHHLIEECQEHVGVGLVGCLHHIVDEVAELRLAWAKTLRNLLDILEQRRHPATR